MPNSNGCSVKIFNDIKCLKFFFCVLFIFTFGRYHLCNFNDLFRLFPSNKFHWIRSVGNMCDVCENKKKLTETTKQRKFSIKFTYIWFSSVALNLKNVSGNLLLRKNETLLWRVTRRKKNGFRSQNKHCNFLMGIIPSSALKLKCDIA